MVHTDQKSLRLSTEQMVMTEEQQRWISKLLGYDFEIKYKPGIENKAADALSRKLQKVALSTVQFYEWEDIEAEVEQDDGLKKIMQKLVADPTSHTGYKLYKGRLYYNGRMVVPRNSSKIPLILKEFHGSALGGHSGYFRTYKRISGLFFWEGMKGTIQ